MPLYFYPPLRRGEDDDKFSQLTTNPYFGPPGPALSFPDRELECVRADLQSLLESDGASPRCPLAHKVEATNGYHVRLYPDQPDSIVLPRVLLDLLAAFQNILRRRIFFAEPAETVTTVAAFTHQDVDEKFCRRLCAVPVAIRQLLLDSGYMLAYMHPFQEPGSGSTQFPDGGTGPAYRSAVPLLMVRRMHQVDYVFMRTADEKAAYASFFPEV